MSEQSQSGTNWKAVRGWIVGITSVLVVLPALLNAAVDLFNTVMKTPRTESEEYNINLFKKHMGEQPIVDIPLPVRLGAATYDANFSIYDGGDVYVKYGNTTQWFPFPESQQADATSFNLISIAIADDTQLKIAANYKQTESLDGDYLIRKKTYADGQMEQQTIDIRSGRIIERKQQTMEAPPAPTAAEPAATAARAASASTPAAQVIAPFAVIDLNAAKNENNQQAAATTCITTRGNCTLLQALPTGIECSCITADGEISGMAR